MSEPFLDSNVVVYGISESGPKKVVARGLMAQRFVSGAQVLNEMSNVARKKLRFDWNEIRAASELVISSARTILPTETIDHQLSLNLAERYQLAIYDALMLAIALRAGCTTFYSEDMQHGFVVDGRMTVVNPFR